MRLLFLLAAVAEIYVSQHFFSVGHVILGWCGLIMAAMWLGVAYLMGKE
jgi:hypothetical protein